MENAQFAEAPKNINCEIELLSGIFYNADILPQVMDMVDTDDFYMSSHKVIYKAICSIFADGHDLSLTQLIETIGKDNLNSAGGISYLTDLMMNGIRINAQQYIDILKDKSFRRKAIRKLYTAVQELYDEKKNPFEIIEKSMDDVLGETQHKRCVVDDAALINKTLVEIEARINSEDDIPGMKTGLRDFDRNIGGLQKGELDIIAGRPSMGKTLFSLNISDGLGENGYKTLLCELEMTEKAIGMRRLSYSAHVESEKMKFGKLSHDEKCRILEAGSSLALRDSVYTDCTPGQSLLSIRSKAKSIKKTHGLDVIIVDHLGLMDMSAGITRDAAIGEVTRGLKSLAKEMDVCVILICQLKRAVEERADKRPMLSDLRESGNIEQDADMVAFLYRDEYYNKFTKDKGIMECIIGKQRNGRIGTIRFAYEEEFQRISNL